jgi:hypothetical protein
MVFKLAQTAGMENRPRIPVWTRLMPHLFSRNFCGLCPGCRTFAADAHAVDALFASAGSIAEIAKISVPAWKMLYKPFDSSGMLPFYETAMFMVSRPSSYGRSARFDIVYEPRGRWARRLGTERSTKYRRQLNNNRLFMIGRAPIFSTSNVPFPACSFAGGSRRKDVFRKYFRGSNGFAMRRRTWAGPT